MQSVVVGKRGAVLIFCVISFVFVAVSFTFSCAVASVMASKNYVPIARVQTAQNKVSLTVNVYENTDVDFFIKSGDGAEITFFVSEAFENRFPEKIARISDLGYSIGILADNLKGKSRQEINDILASRIESLARITGENALFVRFDYNLYDNNAVKAVFDLGLIAVQWAADDSSENFSEGDIILLTKERNLRELIRKTAADGLEFETVDGLVYKENYKIDLGGVQEKF